MNTSNTFETDNFNMERIFGQITMNILNTKDDVVMEQIISIFKDTPDEFDDYALSNCEAIRESITDKHGSLGLSWIFYEKRISSENVKKILDPKYNIVTSELLNRVFPNGYTILHVALYMCFDLFGYILQHPFMSNETIQLLDSQGFNILHHARSEKFEKSDEALKLLSDSGCIV